MTQAGGGGILKVGRGDGGMKGGGWRSGGLLAPRKGGSLAAQFPHLSPKFRDLEWGRCSGLHHGPWEKQPRDAAGALLAGWLALG